MWDYSFCTVYCGRGFVNKKKSCTVNPRNIRKVDVLLCLLRTIVFCELRKKKELLEKQTNSLSETVVCLVMTGCYAFTKLRRVQRQVFVVSHIRMVNLWELNNN